jgi:predicted ribosomally synthesized peptide with nif11-like leader
MSEEQLKAFLEKVKVDTSLQEQLKAATSPEAVVEIAKEAGFAITAEDIQSMQSGSVELSDEELEGAAGGTFVPALVIPLYCYWGRNGTEKH